MKPLFEIGDIITSPKRTVEITRLDRGWVYYKEDGKRGKINRTKFWKEGFKVNTKKIGL